MHTNPSINAYVLNVYKFHTVSCTQDPMNLGAILRCAYYFGVERVMVAAKNRYRSCVLYALCGL